MFAQGVDLSTAFHHAAQQAALAPSIHNTQPWRFRIEPGALEIYGDLTRQLTVLDPLARQLVISCGCAAFNARVGLAEFGWRARVDRAIDLDPAQPLCRIVASGGQLAWLALGDLAGEIARRHTNRREFAPDPVPPDVVEQLVAAAEQECAELLPITRADDRLALADLSQRADRIENADPAYRAELRYWTTDDPRRADGVPAMAVPHVGGDAGDELPIRDFDTRGMGWLPTHTHSVRTQSLFLLGTAGNRPIDWLRAGEALQRVLLVLTRNGFAASPLTQVVEVSETHLQLRERLGLRWHPHVLLRAGRAPAMTPVNRRPLSDLLIERDVR
jgi:hypothetical protein